MTVAEMLAALQAALDRGLPPETAVVVSTDGWYQLVDSVDDPSNHVHLEDGSTEGPDMWFTLELGEPADSRFTPGGMPR